MGSEICQFALFFGRFDQGVGKAVGVDSIVPTLCVDMHPVTLCFTSRSGTRSVPGGIPTREREERSLTAPAT